MAKYFRRYRRRRNSTRFRRRFFRKPRVGTKRFFARQRRFAKPEIKFFDETTGTVTIPPNASYTHHLTPTTMAQGTGVNERVGRTIKMRYAIQNWWMDSHVASVEEVPNSSDFQYVMYIWTPRVGFDVASAHMLDLSAQQEPDFNLVTVHRRYSFVLGFERGTYQAQTNLFPMPMAAPTTIKKRFVFRFPRNVEFAPNSIQVDPNRSVLYMTVLNRNVISARYNGFHRATFIDP